MAGYGRPKRITIGVAKVGSLVGKTAKAKAAEPVTPHKPRTPKSAVAGATKVGGMFSEPLSPITPGSDITRARLDQLAGAAVQQKYGPADTQMGQQYAQSAGMEAKIPQWFDYYRQQVQGLGLQDAAARQAAQDQITGIGTTLAGATVNAASADQAAMQKDAAIRGATIDPNAYTRAIQAGNVNVQNLGNQAALQTQLGMNQGQYWRGTEKQAEQAKIEQLLNEVAFRRNTLDPQAQQLAREKGAFGQTFRQDTTASEQKNVLERAAFGLDQQKAANSAAADQADAAAKHQQYVLDFKTKHGVGPKKYKAMTPKQRAVSDRRFKNQSTPKTPKPGPSTIADPPSNFTGSPADWNNMPRNQRDTWVKQHPTSKSGTAKPKPADVSAGPGSLTSTSEQKIVSQINTAAGLMVDGLNRGLSRGQIATFLKTGKNPAGVKVADPRVLAVAWSYVDHGRKGIGPTGVRNAHALGIHVNGNFKQLPYSKPRQPKVGSGPIKGQAKVNG